MGFMKSRLQVVAREATQFMDLDVFVLGFVQQMEGKLPAAAALVSLQDHARSSALSPSAAINSRRMAWTASQASRSSLSVSGETDRFPILAALASWFRLFASRALPSS